MHRNERVAGLSVALSLLAGAGLAGEGSLGGFFGEEHLLPPHLNLSGSCWAEGASVTEDGLELYFSRTFDGSSWGFCVARRASREDEWGEVEVLTELGVGGSSIFVMPDGLKIYFSSGGDLYKAKREDRGDPYPAQRVRFGAREPLSEINTAAGEWDLSLTRDERELYFHSNSGGNLDLWVAWRSEEKAENDEPFEHVKRLEISTTYAESGPSISADGLTLFWSDLGDYYGWQSRPGCAPVGNNWVGNIWYATRPQRWVENAQGVEVPLPFLEAWCLGPPIDGPVNDCLPGLTWSWPQSGSEFYFCRYGPGQFPHSQMWVATWHPDCNGDGIDDLDQIAEGDLTDDDGDGVPDECRSPETRFIRGDSNADGIIDISDAVKTLEWLFLGGSDPTCLDSADADDSGGTAPDLSDPVYLLNNLFLGGPAPPNPSFPNCGIDPTADAIGCVEYYRCG